MKYLKIYEDITATQKKNKETKKLASILLKVLDENSFKVDSSYYSNNSFQISFSNIPSELGAIAQYYQSLEICLKDFNLTVIVYQRPVSFSMDFSEKTWEELKMRQKIYNYNL